MSEDSGLSRMREEEGHSFMNNTFSRRFWRALAGLGCLAGIGCIVGCTGTAPVSESNPISESDPISASERVALVIGNADYKHIRSLDVPGHDARAMAEKLQGLGFRVIAGQDLTRSDLEGKLRRFREALSRADVGLFYYAGHGMQVEGENYLLPVDAEPQAEADLELEAVSMELVRRQLRRPPTRLIFLDACRNNPLSGNQGSGRSVGASRGLSRINTDNQGTFIAYATQPGNVAADSVPESGNHSPFTAALLEQLDKADSVANLLIRTRKKVYKWTDQDQIPWQRSSLMEPFYFKAPPQDHSREKASVLSGGDRLQYTIDQEEDRVDFRLAPEIGGYPVCFLQKLGKPVVRIFPRADSNSLYAPKGKDLHLTPPETVAVRPGLPMQMACYLGAQDVLGLLPPAIQNAPFPDRVPVNGLEEAEAMLRQEAGQFLLQRYAIQVR